MSHRLVRAERLRGACQSVLRQVMALDNANYFFKPVDTSADGAPEYFQYITDPMSIFEVQENLDNGKYTNIDSFIADMRRIWQNARVFNLASHPIHRAAGEIAKRFEVIVAAAPHEVSEGASALQRAVELRFSIYRASRRSHQ